MAAHGGARATGQHPKALAELFKQAVHAQQTHTRCRQLNGQGQAVQVAANLCHGLRIVG